jgi:hypothetical protein
MRPTHQIQSHNDPTLCRIVDCISRIECSPYFENHIGRTQADQRATVRVFQRELVLHLAEQIPDIAWSAEHRPQTETNDAIDIFGKGRNFVVAIELDKTRADQIAKKFVSRSALLEGRKLYFLSLCYPGTKSMNVAECQKYFRYCSSLADRMKNYYAALVIQPET